MKFILIALHLLIIHTTLIGQNSKFKYKSYTSAVPTFATSLPNKATYAINYLPKNHTKLAKSDYTSFLQSAINENDVVILPNFPILINTDGLQLRDNSKIYFQSKSKLVMMPNDLSKFELIGIKGKKNVEVYNPVLVGDREFHKGSQGEWGMGINILSSSNVKIYNPIISNCWGDGIYIGKSTASTPTDILIKGGKIDFSRRNGISIIRGENIIISDVVITNTFGTLPMSGIDIEPNSSDDVLKNIQLQNIKTFNNAEDGIKLVFLNLISNSSKTVSINIINHHDRGSKTGLMIGGAKATQRFANRMGGSINITNPIWEDNADSFRAGSYLQNIPQISLKGIKVKKNTKVESQEVDILKKKFSNRLTINN